MATEASNTEPSELSSFLDKFVRETFMPRMEQSFRHRADAITQSNDMWTLLVDGDEQRQLGADVPLLVGLICGIVLKDHNYNIGVIGANIIAVQGGQHVDAGTTANRCQFGSSLASVPYQLLATHK